MIRSEAVILSLFGAVIGIVIGTGLGLALVDSLRAQGVSATAVPVRACSCSSCSLRCSGSSLRAGRRGELRASTCWPPSPPSSASAPTAFGATRSPTSTSASSAFADARPLTVATSSSQLWHPTLRPAPGPCPWAVAPW